MDGVWHGLAPAYLSPGPSEPASATRHPVIARLLRLGSGDLMASLWLG